MRVSFMEVKPWQIFHQGETSSLTCFRLREPIKMKMGPCKCGGLYWNASNFHNRIHFCNCVKVTPTVYFVEED